MTAPAPADVVIKMQCDHCAAGHKPAWIPHSREWAHICSPLSGKGNQYTITICGANQERRGRMVVSNSVTK